MRRSISGECVLRFEELIEAAIRYVEENPRREGKKEQHWSCVTPFAGLEPAWLTYH